MISKKFAIIFLLVLSLIIIAGLLFFYKNKTTNANINATTTTTTVTDSQEIFNKKVTYEFKDNFSIDFINKHLEELRTSIPTITDPNVSARSKLIYFAILPESYLSDGSPEKKKLVLEAYNGIVGIANELDPKSRLYFTAINLIHRTYMGNCFIEQEFDLSNVVKEPLYVEASKKYKGQLAKLVYFSLAFEQLPLYNKDKYNTAMDIFNIALILDSFESELTKEDKDKFINKLQKNIDSFDSKPFTLTSMNQDGKPVISKEIISHQLMAYAYGYQILGKYNKSITKEKILNRYKANSEEIETLLVTEKNISHLFAKLNMSVAYAGYLYEVNGNVVDPEVKKLLNGFMELRNSPLASKEFLAKENFFLMNAQNFGIWNNMKVRFIKIADKSPEFKKYLENNGLKF